LTLSGIAEDIEGKTIGAFFNIESVANTAEAVGADRYAVRVRGVINACFERARAAPIQGEAEKAGKGLPLCDVALPFVRGLLIIEGGGFAPLEALWDVFEHDREVNAVLVTPRKRVLAVLHALLRRAMIPYAIAFTGAISPPPKIAKPFYWAAPPSILKLAHAFLPLRDFLIDLTYAEIESLCSSLS
jgi:hypothetical protein